ncbi:MAG: hypothetical protein IIB00_04700 [candidate division Zixibacteria bacterium]|nr:hypothetical protein [candidate division Zixibacteria bacterium]
MGTYRDHIEASLVLARATIRTIAVFFIALFLHATIFLYATVKADENRQEIDSYILRGIVTYQNGESIPGASIVLYCGDSLLGGWAANMDGTFARVVYADEIEFDCLRAGDLSLRVSSIGFSSTTIHITRSQLSQFFDIQLTQESIEYDAVLIIAGRNQSNVRTKQGEKLTNLTSQGAFLNNPLAAIKGPNVSRSGSALSSQIRFSGSQPDYSLNGISIGRDPTHYGMFSIIPSTALDRVSFTDLTGSASSATPTEIKLESARIFENKSTNSAVLSALEATGTIHHSTEKYFVSATLRKSVLDKLAKRINSQSKRRTIPPTNFEDILVTTGVRLSRSTNLFFDQYHTRDYLDFVETPESFNENNFEAFQHQTRRYFGLELNSVTPTASGKITLSGARTVSLYRANWEYKSNEESVNLNLNEKGWKYRLNTELDLLFGEYQVKLGTFGQLRHYPTVSLQQQNWNFNPPQATSDNPNPYQLALNILYGDLNFADRGYDMALFGEVTREWKDWRASAGLRIQQNDYQAKSDDQLIRISLGRRIGTTSEFSFSAGTYAESPISDILQPFQILVRKNIADLQSIKTDMAKLSYNYDDRNNTQANVEVFTKTISDLPTLTPSFSQFEFNNIEFNIITEIEMKSKGEQTFAGLSVSYDRTRALPGVFGERADFRFGYSFTKVRSQNGDILSHYSEDSPHKFESGFDLRAGRGWKLGAEFNVRSGYRYTTPLDLRDFTLSDLYAIYSGQAQEYLVANENALRFPAHVSLNFSFSKKMGKTEIFGNIHNVLNRANPIISANNGFIYDNGIFPNVGVRVRF